MSLDLYHRNQQTVGGVFTADRAVAAIASGGGSWVSALVQNVQSDYNQNFNEFYELGSNQVFRVIGRPQGRMTIQRILGRAGSVAVEDALFDACNTGGTMTIQVKSSLCAAQGGAITMVYKGLFVINYGVLIGVQDQLIRENLALAFTSFTRIVS